MRIIYLDSHIILLDNGRQCKSKMISVLLNPSASESAGLSLEILASYFNL